MRKKLNIVGMFLCICLLVTACQTSPKVESTETGDLTKTVSVALLKGPTGVGGLGLLDANSKKTTKQPYDISVLQTPDEVMAGLINGEIQIGAVPTNVAAMLYQKTEGEINVAAINTLGVLSILEQGDSIKSLADLSGKTIYVSGQGATPEYALRYLLDKNGVTDVNIEFMQDHAELSAAVVAGTAKIALLPEPNVTTVLANSNETRIALNLNSEWEKVSDGSALSMGCIVVRKDFYEQNPAAFSAFMEEYKASVEFVTKNVAEAAALAVQFEVIPKEEIALKAIPNCSLVFIDGEEMKTKLAGFYEVLFQFNPKAIGGKLPDEAFYITK